MVDYCDALDSGFHALADRSRRSMLSRLTRGPASVGELAAPLEMSLTAVLQHLKVLENAGLVTTRKVGRTRTCTLATDGLRELEGWIAAQRTDWEDRLDRLEENLGRSDDDEDDEDDND